MSNSAAIMSEN